VSQVSRFSVFLGKLTKCAVGKVLRPWPRFGNTRRVEVAYPWGVCAVLNNLHSRTSKTSDYQNLLNIGTLSEYSANRPLGPVGTLLHTETKAPQRVW